MANLLDLVHAPLDKSWADLAKELLEGFARERYGARWDKRLQVRVNGEATEGAAPFAALIPAGEPKSGPYGGMSLVLFPARGSAPALLTLVVGTNGLAPDEQPLGRPGHARKIAAIARWLNRCAGAPVAWAKRDPVRIDLPLPKLVEQRFEPYHDATRKYGKVIYAAFLPGADRDGPNGDALTRSAAHAFADLLAEERGGLEPLADFRKERDEAREAWLASALPSTTTDEVHALLKRRRFAILEGPPGTGKTRMARELLEQRFGGRGRTIQFHPGTTYETFIGGLAPVAGGGRDVGLQFRPKRGHLLELAAAAASDPDRDYLLHLDEINRADLAKVLGEAIYLFEPDEPDRAVTLAHDFGPPLGTRLALPRNLHVLGTMNSADRSIAILDVAVRRRFAFVPIWPDLRVLDTAGASERMKEAFRRLFSIFLEEASDDAFALMPGHAYFLDGGQAPDQLLRTGLKPVLGEYLLQGYVAGFADEIRAYLDWLDAPTAG